MTNEKNVLLKFWEPLCLVFLTLIIGILVMGEFGMEGNIFQLASQSESVSQGWLSNNSGMVEKVNLSNLSGKSTRDRIIIYRTMDAVEGDNARLYIAGEYQYIGVYVGQELRGEYRLDDTGIKAGISPRVSLEVPLYKTDMGRRLSVVLKTDFSRKSKDLVPTIVTGSQQAIRARNYLENGIYLAITLLLFFFSLSCLFIAINFKVRIKRDIGLGYLSIFSALVSLWMAIRSNARQLYMQNLTMAHILTYIIMILIPIPLVLFANAIQNNRYISRYKIVLFIPIVNLVTSLILSSLQIATLSELSWLSSICGTIVLIVILSTFSEEIKQGYRKDVKSINMAVMVIVVAVIIEIIIYYSDLSIQVGSILGLSFVTAGVMVSVFAIKKEFKEEKQQIARLEEMRAKSEFLSRVSHEMRTPIHAILGIDEMIISESENAQIKEYAHEIRKSGRELNSLINDLCWIMLLRRRAI